jgi:BR-signaling kinase
MCDQPDAALRDAMQAQIIYPDWPTAFYMQAVALSKLNMQSDAVDMLNEASQLEEKRQKSTKGPWRIYPFQGSSILMLCSIFSNLILL